MQVKIYNTLTKEKELLKPLRPGKVGLYVCGVTVYDFCHIGHARAYLSFDMVIRYLRYLGLEVTYIRNITDIDDKIIKRALERKEPFEKVTDAFIKAMHEDFQTLNLFPPTLEPRATNTIPQMINMIQKLLDKGFAYVGTTGDVYYDVQKFKTYGCLSHRDLEDLQAGSRVEVNDAKRNPLDFVLWKMAKPDEPSWDSPWGKGRPGWHIECSAMSLEALGETFDIHGGGSDLKFPHHENELAQSEAANGKKFVNTWMHVGFVQIDKEKMSKSLGNFLTIRDFLNLYDAEALRYFSIASHYRSPVEYSDDNIDSAIKGLDRFYTALRGLNMTNPPAPLENSGFEKRFQEAMNDDFNTPEALSVLFDLVREINRERDKNPEEAEKLRSLLLKLGNVLGLLYRAPEDFLQNAKLLNTAQGGLSAEEIEAWIAKRTSARLAKDWAESDRIRTLLLEQGVVLEDTATGTLWRQG